MTATTRCSARSRAISSRATPATTRSAAASATTPSGAAAAADTLAGGFGDDTYAFVDLFGGDTIIEHPGEGSDTMDFSAVTAALEVRLGSVTVTDGSFDRQRMPATTSSSVIGGTADDEFIMTGPTVVFPGMLDGGGGSNGLTYRRAATAIIDAVDRRRDAQRRRRVSTWRR